MEKRERKAVKCFPRQPHLNLVVHAEGQAATPVRRMKQSKAKLRKGMEE